MPTFSTERLDIVPLRAAYAGEAWPLIDDASMWTYFPELRPKTLDALQAVWKKWEAGSPNPEEIWLNWVCREKASRDLVGTMQATVFQNSREAYIAYAIYRKYQGNGYARESCRAIITYIFERFAVERIYAQMHARNEASYRLAESLGFVRAKTTADEYVYELPLPPAR